MAVLMLLKLIWILAENFSVSRNLADNSTSLQNTANPDINGIFYLAGFFLKLRLGSLLSTASYSHHQKWFLTTWLKKCLEACPHMIASFFDSDSISGN